MIMANPNNYLHPQDNIVLDEHFDFSDSIFDLEEPNVESPSNNFITPSNFINSKLKGYEHLFNMALINARSVPKHLHEISKILYETKMDLMCVCETFISAHTPKSAYTINGYNFFHVDRSMKSRGGVGCYISSHFPAKQIKLPVELSQPEMLFIEVTIGNTKAAIGTIYKSPKIPYTVFAAIHENIAFISSKYQHVNILGDFNVDQLKIDSAPQKFLNS